MEVALYFALLVLFATWVTVHTALAWQIGQLRWWRGCLAWAVPPLAPWWGRGWLRSSWLGCCVLYGATLTVAFL
ncbi:MAG TPA: hypothetical protein VLC09_19605 [Polyangiaceae bacterium]|nr:hypothetical protein [Polyangiaceae bacterium]